MRSCRLIGVLAALLLLTDDPRVFAQEEEAVVVDEDGVVAAEEGAPVTGWKALPVVARELDGQRVFMRQSSDAFADPDQRLSLEPQYYFLLEPSDIPAADSFRRGGRPSGFQAAESDSIGPVAEALNAVLKNVGNGHAQWLDYNAPSPGLVALLQTRVEPMLGVARCAVGKDVSANGTDTTVTKLETRRDWSEAEVASIVPCEAPFDTWDISPDWKSKSALLNRVIAVLKRVDDRYCVDFYGAALHADADCRVWLAPGDHEFGAPRGVFFIELPILKEATGEPQVRRISVCAVQFENQAIAFDFPLCKPALMEQMQRLAANRPSKPGEEANGPDLTRIVGPDLLDEFARRLVNGTYR